MVTSYTIAGHSFSTYWTIFLLGIIGMLVINSFRNRKFGLKLYLSWILTVLVVLVSVLGAKILFYMENPMALMNRGVRLGGVSFFGAIFCVPLVMYLICRTVKLPYGAVMDFLSPSLMLVLAVLRIGCFVNGCCGGISLMFAGVYVSQFPTQLTECVCDLLILAGLLFYEHFWEKEGRLYYFIMLYYGIVRFFLEFVRDTPKDWLFMSHGQWFSILSVCIGGYMLQRLGKLERKKNCGKNRKKR